MNLQNRAFTISEQREPVGDRLHLALGGELDLAAAPVLQVRLSPLMASLRPVCLDLSNLGFIDLRGLDAILSALARAREMGCPLEVAPGTSRSVLRLVRLVGAENELWPDQSRRARQADLLPDASAADPAEPARRRTSKRETPGRRGHGDRITNSTTSSTSVDAPLISSKLE